METKSLTETELNRINLQTMRTRLLEQMCIDTRIDSHMRTSQAIYTFMKVPANKMLRINDPEHYNKLQSTYLIHSTLAYMLIEEKLDDLYNRG